jgi:hypothetical protein
MQIIWLKVSRDSMQDLNLSSNTPPKLLRIAIMYLLLLFSVWWMVVVGIYIYHWMEVRNGESFINA